ncbi:MAG: hypothetical protein ACE149_07040 [Armatimonadota bacterium]
MTATSHRQGKLCPQPGENGVAQDSCAFRERVLADPKPWDLLGVSEYTWRLAKGSGLAAIEYLHPFAFAAIDGSLSEARRTARSAQNHRAAARRKARRRWRRDPVVKAAAEQSASAEFERYMRTASPEELAEQT